MSGSEAQRRIKTWREHLNVKRLDEKTAYWPCGSGGKGRSAKILEQVVKGLVFMDLGAKMRRKMHLWNRHKTEVEGMVGGLRHFEQRGKAWVYSVLEP